jgi:hypothetical protein
MKGYINNSWHRVRFTVAGGRTVTRSQDQA